MFSKTVTLFTVIIIQSITGQSIRNAYSTAYANDLAAAAVAAEAPALAYPGIPYTQYSVTPGYETLSGFTSLNYGLTLAELSASNGCGLRIRSASPISPSGVTVKSDDMGIEGRLSVSGQLPFLGAVALEGPLTAAGSGTVEYGCGNGSVGIVNEIMEPAVPAPYPNFPAGYPGLAGYSGPSGGNVY